MATREDNPRPDIGLRRKALTLGCVIAFAGLVVGSIVGDRGLLRLMAQQERTDSLKREIHELEAENGRLAAEIAALRSDPHSVEALAREQLGLARPGETLFLIREDARNDRP